MDWSLARLNKEVKAFDSLLYAIRASNGMLQVYRQPIRAVANLFESTDFNPNPLLVLCLTDTWTIQGKPVEWGLEPVMERLRSMDQWQSGISYEEFCKQRDLGESNEKRAFTNEVRARAMDVRKDFARLTDDINLSTL